MRGTLHLVAAEDAGWLTALIAPEILPGALRRLSQLGISEVEARRALRRIERLLRASGPQTRGELADRLSSQGIAGDSQLVYHLLRLAAYEGIGCWGPDRGGEPAFALLEDWAGAAARTPAEGGVVELARRYLAGYGPARPEDFARWSGLGTAKARRAWVEIEDELETIEVGGRELWDLGRRRPRAPDGLVRLLGAYDPYLLGYAGRDFVVAPEHARRVHPGGGLLRPVVVVDGRAEGIWSYRREAGRVALRIEAFHELEPGIEAALHAEADDVGRFLGLPAATELVPG
jgi:hypothetical protein